MRTFKMVLQSLEDISGIQGIELFDCLGRKVAEIHNKEGSRGSLKIYYHLMKNFPVLDQTAAAYGIDLFAEYADDARNHPRKHPNIDRLFEIERNNEVFLIRIFSD